ncbi:carbohydrate kinase family protein [Nocardioides jiangxiensis]|uniref:Carbohydrate kinase n=1 Tax=Nocardioides jiangxiensis TaxID=3064524 RepID=A0ABT9B0J4_9ACTN|nr:carbohydrate kinase [Nocardioides sp. WY-20]MDO7868377.1 carbohydrate kinase [Nocardioides sp. WY-20]
MSASPPDHLENRLPEPVLVIGEALVDLIRRPGQRTVARVGGSPLNVAVGLSRLDVPAALHTSLGVDDDYGAMIEVHLAENDVTLVAPATARRTSTATAIIDDEGAASYEFDLEWALEPVEVGAPRLVHTGSIGALLAPGAAVAMDAVRRLRPSATVSYDPNVRPALMGDRDSARARIEELVGLADVVKASSEDLAWLYPGEDLDAVAARWLALGPALVVVTHGADGSYAVTVGAAARVPVPDVALVDTIGAGDSFMAGLLAALSDADLLGREHEKRLRALDEDALRSLLGFAAACAAVTVSRPGADPPRRDALAVG